MASSTSMLDDLKALATTEEGRSKLKRAFALFGVKGRKWSELTDDEVGNVWAETNAPEAPPLTPDDSPEGRALNKHLDEIRL